MIENLAAKGIKRKIKAPIADLEIIKEYHPEVLLKLALLSQRMGIDPLWLGNFYLNKKIPQWIESGYREIAKKSKILNSAHYFGIAVDIMVGKLIKQYEWARAATEDNNLFFRAGLYPQQNTMHLDIADMG